MAEPWSLQERIDAWHQRFDNILEATQREFRSLERWQAFPEVYQYIFQDAVRNLRDTTNWLAENPVAQRQEQLEAMREAWQAAPANELPFTLEEGGYGLEEPYANHEQMEEVRDGYLLPGTALEQDGHRDVQEMLTTLQERLAQLEQVMAPTHQQGHQRGMAY